jgi:cytoskeletal protein CcmA (bactofilin family)
MREERVTVAGNLLVNEPLTLWGTVGGDVTVVEGGKFYMRGAIYGDLIVEYGGRVHIFGRIAGNLTVKRGSKVIHSGVLNGDATNRGGRLYIENTATLNGKVKTEKGETQIRKLLDGGPPPREDR